MLPPFKSAIAGPERIGQVQSYWGNEAVPPAVTLTVIERPGCCAGRGSTQSKWPRADLKVVACTHCPAGWQTNGDDGPQPAQLFERACFSNRKHVTLPPARGCFVTRFAEDTRIRCRVGSIMTIPH